MAKTVGPLWREMLLIDHLIASLQSLMPAADALELDPASQTESTFSIGFADLNGKCMMLSSKARMVNNSSMLYNHIALAESKCDVEGCKRGRLETVFQEISLPLGDEEWLFFLVPGGHANL